VKSADNSAAVRGSVKKILIVDDSETIRQSVASALEAAGFQVMQACDGLEGIERIQAERPAMVILDVNMPRLNGLDMLERLDVKSMKLPVLLLTTEVQPSMIARAKQAGARGWMVKPVKLDQLVEAIKKIVD
jgi:two-component system, chemotaxis family, chemotaxis protein CheY